MKLSLDIKRKLYTNNGISILFSLLLFLVVSMVSVTIIASASSTSKQLNSIKQSNQANIDLDSAVLLIKNEISNLEYYHDSRTTGNKNQKYNNYGTDSKDCSQQLKNNVFYKEIDSLSIKYLDNTSSNSNNYEDVFTINSMIDNINDVKVSYKYLLNKSSSNSYVIFKLSIDDQSFDNTTYVKFSINYKENKINKNNSSYSKEGTRYVASYIFSGVYQYDPS